MHEPATHTPAAPQPQRAPQRGANRPQEPFHAAVRREQGRAKAGRFAALDGLRGVSILLVLLGHGGHSAGANAAVRWFRSLGILGVFLFFGISGFIITWLLLGERERSGTIDLAAFWRRRAWRILPPFAGACAGTGAAAAAGLLAWSWPSFWGAVSFTKDTRLLPGDWFFGHYWSLSLEEQFYLFWPLLLLLFRPVRRSAWVLLAVAAASPGLSWLCTLQRPQWEGWLSCLPYLAAGCLAAVLFRRDHRPGVRAIPWLGRRLCASPSWRWLGITVLPVCVLLVSYQKRELLWPQTGALVEGALAPAASFMLVVESIRPRGLLAGVLAWAPLRWLGLVSYSVYLWQQLFMGQPEVYRHAWFWSQWPQNAIAAMTCGALSYLCIERPGAALRQRLERRRPAQPAAAIKTPA